MLPEILKNLSPSISAFAQVSTLAAEAPIPQGKEPIVVKVEPAPADKKTGAAAWKYTVMLPGSAFTKLEIKVKEATPSITQAEIEARGGMVKVSVQGFRSGFLDGDKGMLFYAGAEKIVPIGSLASTAKQGGAI